jgi:hypothetical protein
MRVVCPSEDCSVYELLWKGWPVISFTYSPPFIIYYNVCCFSFYLPVISAVTIILGPTIFVMQNNFWPLFEYITGQFCSRLIAMGTPGVGTGCQMWEVRRFLCACFYSGRRFRKWIGSVPNAIALPKRSVWYSLTTNPLKHFGNCI